MGLLLTGMALGATFCGGAAAAGIVAVPTRQPIYVDGQQVKMEAYNINGSNYVKLRDAGRQVGFNVYWDNGVQVDTGAPYTGVAPTRDEQSVPASAATGTYSHIRPDGSDRSTVSNCPYTAENIHRIADRRLAELGKGLAEVVVDDWAASSGHLKNILNDGLSEIGVGLARGMNAAGEDCWYCVQIFAYEGYHVTWVDNPVE